MHLLQALQISESLYGIENCCSIAPEVLASELNLEKSTNHTVVLYIGIMKVWGFWPNIITPKPA